MSDVRCRSRRAIAAIVVLGIAAGAAPTARAQSAAQLRTRLDAALRIRKAAADSVELEKARAALNLPPESLLIDGVRVQYSKENLGSDLEATLRAAVRDAAATADFQFGDARFEGPSAVIVVHRIQTRQLASVTFDMVQVELPGSAGRSSLIRSPITKRKLADDLLDMMGSLATNGMPQNVSIWAGFWAPSRPSTPDDWQAAALDLTTSTSSVSRTCFSGSLSGCESALGLTRVHDMLHEWYTPDGWRALVSMWDPPKGDPALMAAYDECVEKKVLATCERLAPTRRIPVPLNMSTRSTLFNLAIARGGRAAYVRLRSATGTPLEVLSNVAGVPPDVLIEEWRTRILAAVPHSARPSVGDSAVLVAWTLLFGVVATRRRPWK